MEKIIALIILHSILPIVHGLLAYDCESEDVDMYDLNLKTVGSCGDAITDYSLQPENKTANVVQAIDGQDVTIYNCHAWESRTGSYCMWNSDVGAPVPHIWLQAVYFSKEECIQAFERGYFIHDGRNISFTENEKEYTTYTVNGFVKDNGNDGRCKVDSANYIDYGVVFPWSVIRVQLGFSFMTTQEFMDNNSPVLEIKSMDDLEIPNIIEDTSLYLFSQKNGATVVKKKDNPLECTMRMSGIFSGVLSFYPHKDTGLFNGYFSGLDAPRKINFAGKMHEFVQLCDRRCYRTQIRTIYICDVGSPIRRIPFHGGFEEVDKEGQLSYSIFETNRETEKSFVEVKRDMCKVEKKALSNSIHGAAMGNVYAMLDDLPVGQRPIRRGNVAYVLICKEVNVTMAPFPNCTQELPVQYRFEGEEKNVTAFLDTYNLIIQRKPTLLECIPGMPVKYNINGRWFCRRPPFHVDECRAPLQMRPDTKPHHVRGDLLYNAGSDFGLLTDEQREIRRRAKSKAVSEHTVINHLQMRINDPHKYDEDGHPGWGSYLDDTDIVSILSQVPKFLAKFLGLGFLGFMGPYIFVVLKLAFAYMTLKYVIKMFIGCNRKYVEKGPGSWMFCFFWQFGWDLMSLPKRIIETISKCLGINLEEKKEDIEMGDVKNVNEMV